MAVYHESFIFSSDSVNMTSYSTNSLILQINNLIVFDVPQSLLVVTGSSYHVGSNSVYSYLIQITRTGTIYGLPVCESKKDM